ncbi:MarR family winged helix-turn-helix transcriptional regulator [Inquilinus sp.]|jgi:MarR family transcriptional regulator for hemolysin|uniref:MarR family winged helix-turn-helix transcriptional regulator n=1 Tax=Inquilinus sp. TaxID=1932117 RepID=UPI003783F784
MSGTLSTARDDFGFRLYLVGRLWRREVDETLGRYGLSAATWQPLLHVSRLGEGIRQRDLAESLGIEGPSLVRLLDTLETQGLIERREDESDRRAKAVHLTEDGRTLVEGIRGIAAEVRERLLAGVSDEDMMLCLGLLGRVEGNLAAGRPEPEAGR